MKHAKKRKEIDVTDLPKEEGYCFWQESHNDCYHTQCGACCLVYLSDDMKYCPCCSRIIKKVVEVTMFNEEVKE